MLILKLFDIEHLLSASGQSANLDDSRHLVRVLLGGKGNLWDKRM
ncbi:hypothetical protein [Parapedobacter koreensis]|nr:hypothetical protein [Parapedobacter koreensis]